MEGGRFTGNIALTIIIPPDEPAPYGTEIGTVRCSARDIGEVLEDMALASAARKIPWQALFTVSYRFRRHIFGKSPEPVDHLLVEDASATELKRTFLRNGLMKGDYASYYYYGEELNMVAGLFKDDEYEWYQYHVRGFETDEGLKLRPHTELYWRTYPRKHIKLVNLDVDEGISLTEEILDENDYSYEVIHVGG